MSDRKLSSNLCAKLQAPLQQNVGHIHAGSHRFILTFFHGIQTHPPPEFILLSRIKHQQPAFQILVTPACEWRSLCLDCGVVYSLQGKRLTSRIGSLFERTSLFSASQESRDLSLVQPQGHSMEGPELSQNDQKKRGKNQTWRQQKKLQVDVWLFCSWSLDHHKSWH